MTTETVRLPPRVRELVAADAPHPPPAGRLTARQVEVLVSIVTGATRATDDVNMPRAIGAVAAGARPETAVEVLDDILGRRRATPTERIAAARGLGVVATAEAEAALLRRTRITDQQVQRAVLASLGRFAGPRALARLARLDETRDDATRRQLALTRALIAHRHGLDGPFLPTVRAARRPSRGSERIDLTEVVMRVEPPKKTATAVAQLQGSSYGIDLAERGFALAIGGSESIIFLNAALGTAPTKLARVFERPWLAAIFGRWYVDRPGPTTRYLVLTRPSSRGAHLDVVRTDGTVVYTGTLTRADAGVTFDVADTGHPGATAIRLAGTITSRGVDLSVVDALSRRRPALGTVPIAAPPT